MILGSACLGARALDGSAIAAALQGLGLDSVLLVTQAEASAPNGLAALPVRGVRTAWEQLTRGIEVARAASCRRLIVELPEEAEVDGACRALFDLQRSEPGLSLAVLTPRAGPLAAPAALQLVLEDLVAQSVAYWHVPSRSHRLGLADAAWFDLLGRHTVGLSLDDVLGEDDGLPPGTGELDLAPVAELGARSLLVALDTAPLPDVSFLAVALRDLQLVGFQ